MSTKQLSEINQSVELRNGSVAIDNQTSSTDTRPPIRYKTGDDLIVTHTHYEDVKVAWRDINRQKVTSAGRHNWNPWWKVMKEMWLNKRKEIQGQAIVFEW